jgi:AcrR family transcriptional regulator
MAERTDRRAAVKDRTAGRRADAARNIATVLEAGARLLAEDPGASMSAIAAAAGVDRGTVYRHFENRDALVCAIYHATLDAMDNALDGARLEHAPVAVALHRLAEDLITLIRSYPISPEQMCGDPETERRVEAHQARVERFLRRAADEGVIRADLPIGMDMALLRRAVELLAAHREIDPGPAADLAVHTLLHGIGTRS